MTKESSHRKGKRNMQRYDVLVIRNHLEKASEIPASQGIEHIEKALEVAENYIQNASEETCDE